MKTLIDATQSAIAMSDADEETVAAAEDLWFRANFHMYGQDSSEGIHGIGNPNTDYCWDEARNLVEQILDLV